MTEKNDNSSDLKAVVSNAAVRFVEVYFGEERPIELSVKWRILNSLAGSVTLLAFAFASERMTPLNIRLDTLDLYSVVQNIVGIIMLLSPMLLSLMIGLSIRMGGPLRFFMLGFSLYALLLLVAVN